jgi:hypothetical protein
MRRRAIVGTAVVAGGAVHHMNKKNAQNEAEEEQLQLQQEQEQQALDAQAAQQQAVAPSAGLGSAQIDQLTQLAGLHDQGVLSDEEFAAQKAKILG